MYSTLPFFGHLSAPVSQLGSLSPPEAIITSVATTPCQLSQMVQCPVVSLSTAVTTSLPSTPQVSQACLSFCPSLLPPVAVLPLPTTQPTGIVLAPALQQIPACLVWRILGGEFVEMRDLVLDNIALHNQLETFNGSLLVAATPGCLRPRLREVPSFISCVLFLCLHGGANPGSSYPGPASILSVDHS